MIDWTGDREGHFEYVRLKYPNLNKELDTLGQVTGGQVDEDIEAELFSSASFEFRGSLPTAEDDIVRVYYVVKQDGETARIVLFTGFASSPSLTASSAEESGRVDLLSMLAVLRDDCSQKVYQIKRDTNAIALAKTIAQDVGLTVTAEPSEALTTENKTFDAGTSKLEIVKWLCDFAKFAPPMTNEFGEIILTPQTESTGLAPVYTFEDNSRSIILSDVQLENASGTTPNVVVAIFSGSSKTLVSEAVNSDPTSPISTVNRGRRVVSVLNVSDIAGVSTAYQQASLDKVAADELAKLTAKLRMATVSHAYLPAYRLHQTVRLNYKGARIDLTGKAVSRSITLNAWGETSLKIKAAK